MTSNSSRHSLLQSPPKRTRVLIPLIFGSVALHLLILWALVRFSSPTVKEPEIITEVQLSDLPALPKAAPKPQAAPVIRPQAPPERRAQPARPEVGPEPPRLTRREIVPTAPLVRSTREVAETGTNAKKPVAPRSTVALPALDSASPAQRVPDAIVPRIQKTTPPANTSPAKSARLPHKSGIQNQKTAKGIGAEKSSKSESEKGARAFAKSEINAKKSVGETSPLGNGVGNQMDGNDNAQNTDFGGGLNNGGENKGQNLSTGNGSQNGNNPGAGSRGGNGEGNGSGGGPFGVGGAAGEGPRRIVYILDVSYSMEPRLGRAKEEINDALTGLQAGESFNIIAFYGNVRPFDENLVEATPTNIAGGRAFVDGLRVGRYTNLELAFEKAFAAPGVNVVVLITDGVPTYGLGSPDFSQTDNFNISANFGELAQRVRGLNRFGARIHTVGIVGNNPNGTPARFEASDLLQRIARESSGTFKTVRIDATNQPNSS